MYNIERNGISFSISHQVNDKPYLSIDYKEHRYFIGQLKSNKSAELLQKILDYIFFGKNEDAVAELLENVGGENGAV